MRVVVFEDRAFPKPAFPQPTGIESISEDIPRVFGLIWANRSKPGTKSALSGAKS